MSDGEPSGFAYRARSDGEILITHRGVVATVLRGVRAQRFLADLATKDPQLLMARVTGSYRHGNEGTAREHPRNR